MIGAIEVDDLTASWMSRRALHMFVFVDAVGLALAGRKSGPTPWCPDPWVAPLVRRFARETPARA